MTYAIIKLAGKQYRVSEGDFLTVARLPLEIGKKIICEEVLLLVNDGQVSVGTPVLPAKVTLEVIEHFRGPKIRVSKFKAKVRYRRTLGFRADLTKTKVVKIGKNS